MQLGTRWPVGGDTPARLPAAVVDAVRTVEAEVAGFDTSAWRWTLTWLEGRPIVELDDGTVIRYDSVQDRAVITPPPTD
ncbi:hypothetical protein [Desertivibrio insolitus]|uniref:hypothetical protein n=1 Tax=Herbiconiux sp. SYSU D00978 TaxID=2812562 RepID=UPI001A97431A|nr:hypothetical protein [Herbiconiux sp. SYSU D00978]